MTHIVQTKEWADFKNEYGTKAIFAGGVFYTLHKIPFTNYNFAYCPKINPFVVDFSDLTKSLADNQCVNINFDVPDITKNSEDALKAANLFESWNCTKAVKTQFAASNIVLDISGDENAILKKMHTKHRYNINYALRNDVAIRMAHTEADFDIFYELFRTTSKRQKYFVRPKEYYKKLWERFSKNNMCFILISEHHGEPLASWMFFLYEDVLYYPYGGSSDIKRHLHGSTLLAWEGIKQGKFSGCNTFDMWGASENPEDTNDPWWGFTNFKMKFGGNYIKYMDSYDYVINPSIFNLFNSVNELRWKVLRAFK